MPRKKTDEETVENGGGAEATEETAVTEENAGAVEAGATAEAAGNAEATDAGAEKSNDDAGASEEGAAAQPQGGTSIVDAVVGAVASTVETVASAVTSTVTNLVSGSDDNKSETGRGNRAERVGTVTSDKMTKTVVVRVDRLVKHPKYRKYVRRRKQFMAHDELGATIGDKVRIIETRPLSARKRWRVVEIVQKAAK